MRVREGGGRQPTTPLTETKVYLREVTFSHTLGHTNIGTGTGTEPLIFSLGFLNANSGRPGLSR